MKPLCLRGPFLSRAHNAHFPSLFLRIYQFSTVSAATASYPNLPRFQAEDSRNVQVSVWWDFENCNIPTGVNKFKVTQTITAAIRANGIRGPIQITAFGDVTQLSTAGQEALTSTGVLLNHVPRGGKNSADRSLLVDLMCWTSQNPPPAHLFLISGDGDFAGVLHRLRMVNYNILLAGREDSPAVLCSAASIMWHWLSLIRGEDVNGKRYNQPPDGPYGSWYGHYKRPLDDPFADQQQPLSSDADISQMPKTVLRQVQCILHSHPKGISIADLSQKLHIPKYESYKKLIRFFVVMPHIGKLRLQGNGKYLVMPVGANKRPSKHNVGQVGAGQMEDGKVEVAENSESDTEIEKKTSSESLQELINSDKPEDESDKRMAEVKIWKSNHPNGDAASSESLADESASKEQTSLFQKLVKICTFWRTSDEPKLSSDQSNKTINEQISHSSPGNEIFSKNTFWSDMKSFLDSPRGSVVGLSTTRASVARKLQKEGPEALRALSQTDLLHLVDLLIDEKKLVEENPSLVLPFKIVKPQGLRAMTSDKHVTEENRHNDPCSKVSSPPPKATGGSSASKKRHQILKDCKVLVKDILRKHPDGYNYGKFRNDFADKYGYTLYLEIFGYTKLSTFLKTLPGVVVDGCFIFPSKTDDDLESAWNELGPVSSSNPEDGAESYISSDSENESCGAKQREVPSKQEKAFLQTLDSCYNKKER